MRRNKMMMHGAAAALTVSAIGLLPACTPPSGPVVASSDSTPPAASLSLSHSPSGSASSGTLTLLTKTGPLYFTATGQDQESGVQDVEIWISTTSTSCDTEICSSSVADPGAPTWTSTSPKKNPGEPMSVNSVLIEWTELTTSIPQQPVLPGHSRSRTWEAWAVVKNNFGMKTTTGSVKADWSESA